MCSVLFAQENLIMIFYYPTIRVASLDSSMPQVKLKRAVNYFIYFSYHLVQV